MKYHLNLQLVKAIFVRVIQLSDYQVCLNSDHNFLVDMFVSAITITFY